MNYPAFDQNIDYQERAKDKIQKICKETGNNDKQNIFELRNKNEEKMIEESQLSESKKKSILFQPSSKSKVVISYKAKEDESIFEGNEVLLPRAKENQSVGTTPDK